MTLAELIGEMAKLSLEKLQPKPPNLRKCKITPAPEQLERRQKKWA
jgi:hypothetical protein